MEKDHRITEDILKKSLMVEFGVDDVRVKGFEVSGAYGKHNFFLSEMALRLLFGLFFSKVARTRATTSPAR